MGKHSSTIVGLLAIIVIVFAASRLMPHHQTRQSTGDIPVSEWKYSGYMDPKSAIISAAAAVRKDDGQAIVDSFTPEFRKLWEFNLQSAMQKNNKTLAQLISGFAPRAVADATIHIVQQRALSDRWALMIVKVSAGGKLQTVTVVLRKIDGEWKVDDFQTVGLLKSRKPLKTS